MPFTNDAQEVCLTHRIRDMDVYYEVRGTGRLVLMLHGFTPDHRLLSGCMEPVFAGRSGWRRLYLDLPGMGKTPGPSWVESTDGMLEVAEALIDAVAPGERMLLVGESYGGYLARALVQRRPDSIAGLCLLCPLVHPQRGRRELPRHVVLVREEGLEQKLDPPERQAYRERFRPMAVVDTRAAWTRFRDNVLPGILVADHPFLSRISSTGYALRHNPDDLPEPFLGPSLFLVGRQDEVVGYRDLWRILELYPRATYAVLDTAGHCLESEQPVLFASLVREWLDRAERGFSSQGVPSALSAAGGGHDDVKGGCPRPDPRAQP